MFWLISCCGFFSSAKFRWALPQRPAQVLTLVMHARIVSIASTAPRKAGSAVFVSSEWNLAGRSQTGNLSQRDRKALGSDSAHISAHINAVW